MKKDLKISVIIPAYNAEKYLAEALDSVVFQTMPNSDYEIIIVNDGSSDHTLEILTKYKQLYSNIIIINKKNGGPSSARNAGLDIAHGEYIYFFDADDLLINNSLEALYQCAQERNADLVIGKYNVLTPYKLSSVHTLDNLVCLDNIDKYNTDILQTFALWNKLFRLDLIKQHHLNFKSVSYSEDGIFVMNYVLHCTKITGLDQALIQYRRFNESIGGSITASVSESKIRDYLTAHEMILDCAKESFLRDFPVYTTIEDAMADNEEISDYLNTIIHKELLILLNRFYAKFWTLDSSTAQFLLTQINDKLNLLNMKSFCELRAALPELPLTTLSADSEEVLKRASLTAVLYGNDSTKEDFLSCLKSLTEQNMVFIKIVVPSSMKVVIQTKKLLQKNIIFTDCNSQKDLFNKALDEATTSHIVFCDEKIVYSTGAFRRMNKLFSRLYMDFVTEAIYHKNYGSLQPLIYSHITADFLASNQYDTLCLGMEATLANKFFSVSFLRNQNINFNLDIIDFLDKCYHTGYYLYNFDELVIYNGTEKSFLKYTETETTLPLLKEYFKAKSVTLNSPELLYNPLESGEKFRPIPETEAEQPWTKEVEKLKKKKLQNKVAFVSVRSDGELEGNALALYPYINGEKEICAHKLPHDNDAALAMSEAILTSKVIVTDDYVKYLRYFPLRPEQRVIQLWHACGAFKKFGQRGTNIPVPTDIATHAQYNLVSVSGEQVRSIYADAFDVNYQKVQALGVPRTDDYFNKKLISKKKRQIYLKHPKLLFKSVLVYAPTFRDTDGNRNEFQPEIDFDLLSKSLLPNQVLLICPHPVMDAPILPHKYHNILEVRDFSTNDYMLISDMLITDYSSVIFEYALLGKPIAFFCYDLLRYDRDFYLKYPDDLPGDVFKTQEEITEYLRNPEKQVLTDKYTAFVKKYMSACDGHSCERIAALINSYMEEN